MPGLPFVSLDEALTPEERPLIERQNQQVASNAQDLTRDRAAGRSWIESVWDAPAQQPAQQAGTTDPFGLADSLEANEISPLTSSRTTAEGRIKGSLKLADDNFYKEYQVEANGLRELGLDSEQYTARHQQLQTKYRLAHTKEANKIQPDLDELDMRFKKAEGEVRAKWAAKRIEMKTIQTIGEEEEWGTNDIRRRQLQALGVAMPPNPKEQTPRERLQEISPVLDEWEDELTRYRIKDGKIQVPTDEGGWSGGTTANRQPTDKEWRSASSEEQADFFRLRRDILPLRKERSDLRFKIAGRHTTDFKGTANSTASPIAQTVTNARQAAGTGLSDLSDDELKRIAGVQ